MNSEDVLAATIAAFDLATYAIMGYLDIAVPLIWTIGILYPSLAWYFLLRWLLRSRQTKKTGHL